MNMTVLSNYGADRSVIDREVTHELIEEVVRELDWQQFHQVILEKEDGDRLEVGGSLDPSDGLSVLYEESGKQFVIADAPGSIEELIAFLRGYLDHRATWNSGPTWV
jgi:hypothetical protein